MPATVCASGSAVEHLLAKEGVAGSIPVSRFFVLQYVNNFSNKILFCEYISLYSSFQLIFLFYILICKRGNNYYYGMLWTYGG